MKHASIVPLIGGMTLGAEKSFGKPPEYMLSYEPFGANDYHIVKHYDGLVPYLLLDKNQKPAPKSVDVVHAVCPCAGLSMLSQGYGDDNENNKWMLLTANYVLGELQPEVFYGENAPGFAGKIGENVRNQLFRIGLDNGYVMSVYRTKSLLHGIPQVRERSFYFFWRGDRIPLLHYYGLQHKPIEQVITEARGNTLREPINQKKPSNDPYFQYIMERLDKSSYRNLCSDINPALCRGKDLLGAVEVLDNGFHRVKDWMEAHGHTKEVEKCNYRINKLASGGSIMKRGIVIPKDYIGAFVGHYPTSLVHPIEDRYINYREALTIMGMPDHFELQNASKNNVNHICQNVPVGTAADMALEVISYLEGRRDTIKANMLFQYNHSQSHEIVHEAEKSSIEHFFS